MKKTLGIVDRLIFCVISVAISACASMPYTSAPLQAGNVFASAKGVGVDSSETNASLKDNSAKEQETKKHWSTIQFLINRGENNAVEWHRGALIADKVVLPIIHKFSDDIALYRIHRRAIDDEAGHKFSFIFYANESINSLIEAELANNPIVKQLLNAEIIKSLSLQAGSERQLAGIESASDKSWTPVMQRSWPYFIMGASQLWLDMLRQWSMQIQQSSDADSNDLGVMLELYQQVEQKLKESWRYEGSHALLHHLNAVFSYKDTLIYERRPVRF